MERERGKRALKIDRGGGGRRRRGKNEEKKIRSWWWRRAVGPGDFFPPFPAVVQWRLRGFFVCSRGMKQRDVFPFSHYFSSLSLSLSLSLSCRHG